MGRALWIFSGFVTEAANQVVQDWYWDDIDIDERDAIRDRVNYLASIERHLWKRPHFEYLGDIGEIRKTTRVGGLRIYGTFTKQARTFVLLHGVLKKVSNDTKGKATAQLRRKKLEQGTAATHEFDFEEKPT